MKKRITLIALFMFSVALMAQENVFYYSYRSVPADEMDLFRKNEAEFWSKVHANLLKKGQITGWAMLSRYGGVAKDPNIYFYIGMGSFENIDNAWENYQKAYDEVMSTMDSNAQKKMEERLKQDKFMVADVMLNRRNNVWKDNNNFRYIVHNYAKAENVGDFLDAQEKYFKPFFEEHMKAGNTKQVGWITASVMNPVGETYNWNCYTADAYENLSDVYNAWNKEVAYPEEGMAEVGKIMSNKGFYKRVIWHLDMWLDGDGNFHTAWD